MGGDSYKRYHTIDLFTYLELGNGKTYRGSWFVFNIEAR